MLGLLGWAEIPKIEAKGPGREESDFISPCVHSFIHSFQFPVEEELGRVCRVPAVVLPYSIASKN